MKKIILVLGLCVSLIGLPGISAPNHQPIAGGVRYSSNMGQHNAHRQPMHNGGISVHINPQPHHARPPMPISHIRHYRPIFRTYPYYYYPSTYYVSSYSVYPECSYAETITEIPATNTVIVRDNYAGINTAANLINTAANVAATIKYLGR